MDLLPGGATKTLLDYVCEQLPGENLLERDYKHLQKITFCEGEIQNQEDIDAIVNAANSTLMGSPGVNGDIWQKAGPRMAETMREVKEALRRANRNGVDTLPAGCAVVSESLNIRQNGGGRGPNWIIHAVAPSVAGVKTTDKEKKGLLKAYLSSLRQAIKLQAKSIAFPMLGVGIFGFPKDRASKIAMFAVVKSVLKLDQLDEIRLVMFKEKVPANNSWPHYVNRIEEFCNALRNEIRSGTPPTGTQAPDPADLQPEYDNDVHRQVTCALPRPPSIGGKATGSRTTRPKRQRVKEELGATEMLPQSAVQLGQNLADILNTLVETKTVAVGVQTDPFERNANGSTRIDVAVQTDPLELART